MTSGPLIVQSDKTALLEVDHPQASDARHELAIFAELERAPEHIHTYRITRLGLWNARAAGHDSDFVLDVLEKYSKFAVPTSVRTDIAAAPTMVLPAPQGSTTTPEPPCQNLSTASLWYSRIFHSPCCGSMVLRLMACGVPSA